MQTLDHDSAVIPFPESDATPLTAAGNYEAVRFNAMQHGLASGGTNSEKKKITQQTPKGYRTLLAHHSIRSVSKLKERPGIIKRSKRKQ